MGLFKWIKDRLKYRSLMKKKRAIRRYYRTVDTATLWLPPDPSHRQFRFGCISTTDGSYFFKKIPDRVKDTKTLKKWLVRYAPFHVYYTTSTWLDPQRLGAKNPSRSARRKKKGGYPVAHNVFLNQELYFDIDMPNMFKECKKEVLDLEEYVRKEYGVKDTRIIFSGGKGFHLYAYDFNWKDHTEMRPEDPRLREALVTEIKAKVVNDIVKKDFVIDAEITMDTRRIIRLPGTVHGKTLNLCTMLSRDEVDGFRPSRIPH